ncbi:hypothetical protein TcBrA4_0075940 [Trypanosoma cruzi]|nr:hypothetical protein TcBrA4_0075940 [Trypanosoma cruzi]
MSPSLCDFAAWILWLYLLISELRLQSHCAGDAVALRPYWGAISRPSARWVWWLATFLCHMASFLITFGPKPIFILSMVLFPLGALLFALSFRGTIEGSVVRLSVFNAILTLGCTLYDVVYMMTIMSHFPNSKGLSWPF